MNYIQETPFMELYEELSILNEEASAELADTQNLVLGDITTTTIPAIKHLVVNNIYPKFINALNDINQKLPLKDLLRPKGIMFYFGNTEIHTGGKYVNLGGSPDKFYLYDMVWKNSTAKNNKAIDLSGSYLGFCFISNTIKDNPNFGDMLIKQLYNYFGEVAIKDSAKLMQPKVGTQIRKLPGDNVFGVFIKYDKNAKIALADVCDEFSPSISIGKANEFIKNFNTSNDKSYKTCTASDALFEIQNAIELRNIAFYIPGLVTYYQSNATLQNRAPLLSLLSLFDCKAAQGKKSLQYLYNAGLQEDIIEKLGKDIGLVRNPKATRTYNVPDNEKYHYLLMPESTVGEITGETDFLFKGYLVDAKIYGNTALMQKYTSEEDKSSHGAHFLIVYLKHVNNEPRWRLLYRQDPNDSFKDWYKESATDFAAAKTLAALIETFPGINLAEL